MVKVKKKRKYLKEIRHENLIEIFLKINYWLKSDLKHTWNFKNLMTEIFKKKFRRLDQNFSKIYLGLDVSPLSQPHGYFLNFVYGYS